jgi:hypothetical protein
MTTKPIQKFIVESEENLHIAEAVAEALPNARHQLAVDFLARLDARLKEGFPGWKSENYETFFCDRYATYYFWKPEWAGQYGLCLQFGEYGKVMVYGVYREKEKIGNRPFCDELMRAVKAVEVYRRAETNIWWDAVIHMDSPAENWRKPEVLWRMYKDDAFLNDVVEQLLELAKISEPIVDQLVQKYRK